MTRAELIGHAKEIVAGLSGAQVRLEDGTEVGILPDGRIYVDYPIGWVQPDKTVRRKKVGTEEAVANNG